MTLHPESDVLTCGEQTLPPAQPVYFAGHFGVVHLPAAGTAIRGGVVLCPSLGREQRTAHRPLKVFAAQLAERGFAVLRYEHLDTGDSARLKPDEDAWSQWIVGVLHAGAYLQEEVGAKAVAFAGLRIGASIAALAAQIGAADALMLLAPVAKGSSWVRELRLTAKMMDPHGHDITDGEVDTEGLRLSEATARAASEMDLGKLRRAPAEVFLASPTPVRSTTARLQELGAQVQAMGFPGYEDLLQESYINTPPQEVFDAAAAWLERVSAGWPKGRRSRRPLPAPVLDLGAAEETAVRFGQGLEGVLCAPKAGATRAVIFTNTGGDPRSGIGGFAADCARRLALKGVASLRFDFAGLGESAFAPEWRSNVYETSRGDDFDAAVSLLQAHGYADIAVVGICSGAFHAVRAAFRDGRITGVMAVNPGDWVWQPGRPLIAPDHVAGSSTHKLISAASSGVMNPDKWKRLVRGELRVGEKFVTLVRRIFDKSRMKWEQRADTAALRREMMQLSARAARCTVVLSIEDAALDEIEVHFGRRASWLAKLPGVQVRILSKLDHGLFFAESRRTALRELMAFLELPAEA